MKKIFLLFSLLTAFVMSSQTLPITTLNNLKISSTVLGTVHDSVLVIRGSDKIVRHLPVSAIAGGGSSGVNSVTGTLVTGTSSDPIVDIPTIDQTIVASSNNVTEDLNFNNGGDIISIYKDGSNFYLISSGGASYNWMSRDGFEMSNGSDLGLYSSSGISLNALTGGCNINSNVLSLVKSGNNLNVYADKIEFGTTTPFAPTTTIQSTTATANRTITFKDESGTVAYLSDITSGSGTVTNVTATSPIHITSTSTVTPNVTVDNAAADNTTFGVATFLPADFNSSAGAISLDYTNGQSANTSTKGYLNSADWNTFNGKQNAITGQALTKTDDTNVTLTLGGTPTTALLVPTSLTVGWTGTLSSTRGGLGLNTSASTGVATVSSGTWSVNALGTAFNKSFGTATTNIPEIGATLTASKILATDGSSKLQPLDTATYPSLTELSYGKGVTSAIQTQLNAKLASSTASTTYLPIASPTFTGDLRGNTTSETIGITGGWILSSSGTSGVLQFLSGSGGNPSRITFGTAGSSQPAITKDGPDLAITNGNNTANRNLTLAGLTTAYTAKTATYTLVSTDYTVNCTANTFTTTLPTAVGIAGKTYIIVNSGAGAITIATTSSQTFTNVTATPTTLMMATMGSRMVQSDGANWMLISSL